MALYFSISFLSNEIFIFLNNFLSFMKTSFDMPIRLWISVQPFPFSFLIFVRQLNVCTCLILMSPLRIWHLSYPSKLTTMHSVLLQLVVSSFFKLSFSYKINGNIYGNRTKTTLPFLLKKNFSNRMTCKVGPFLINKCPHPINLDHFLQDIYKSQITLFSHYPCSIQYILVVLIFVITSS